mgnify:CR=1 FL=1
MAETKRAIALAGGGPAVGLSIVAWRAVAWNQSDLGREYEQTVEFLNRICRSQKRYDRCLITAAFAPDFFSQTINAEEDVQLFKYKLAEGGRDIRVIEIPVEANISYDWTWENLDRRIEDGYRATDGVLSAYRNTTGDVTVAKLQAASNDAA